MTFYRKIRSTLNSDIENDIINEGAPNSPKNFTFLNIDSRSNSPNISQIFKPNTQLDNQNDNLLDITYFNESTDSLLGNSSNNLENNLENKADSNKVDNLTDNSTDSNKNNPSQLDNNIEFSNSLNVMRFIKSFIYLQIIAIMIDHPSIQITIYFKYFTSYLLLFTIKFYSRIYVWVITVIQLFYMSIFRLISKSYHNRLQKSTSSTNKSANYNIDPSNYISNYLSSFISNYLSSNDTMNKNEYNKSTSYVSDVFYFITESINYYFNYYIMNEQTSSSQYKSSFINNTLRNHLSTHVSRSLSSSNITSSASSDYKSIILVDFTDSKNLHTIIHYSDFFYGILAVMLIFHFTFIFWEFSDFTDRDEVRHWMVRYIADGWWRRGSFHVLINIVKAVVLLTLIWMFLYAVSKEFSSQALPEPRIIGTGLALIICTVVFLWFVMYIFLRFIESSFVRYVSQNVSYGSVLIIKRLVKCKIDIGLALMWLLYIPVLYVFLQSLIVITDWNDNKAFSFRKSANFYVPCYFMSFPPYHNTDLPLSTCPVAYANSLRLTISDKGGYYDDHTILPCDTFLGVVFYTAALICFSFFFLGFGYLIFELTRLVKHEFIHSNRVQVLVSLIIIRHDEVKQFQNSFSLYRRSLLEIKYEIQRTIAIILTGVKWLFATLFDLVFDTIRLLIVPIIFITKPIYFILKRLAIISCFNSFTEEGRYNYNQKQIKELKTKRKKEKIEKIEKIIEKSVQESHQNSYHSRSRDPLNKRNSLLSKSSDRYSRSNSNNILQQRSSSIDRSSYDIPNRASFLTRSSSDNSNFTKTIDVNEFVQTLRKIDKRNFIDDTVVNKNKNKNGYNKSINSFDMLVDYIMYLLSKITCFNGYYSRFIAFIQRTERSISTSSTMANIKLISKKVENFLSGNSTEITSADIAKLGGRKGQWRLDMRLQAKSNSIQNLGRKILDELRTARRAFILDDILLIGPFDVIMNSAGLFQLICQYSYDHLYFILAFWLELSIYVVIGALSNYYLTWETKIKLFMIINAIFGIFTYIIRPYTEDIDGWLDFVSRFLLVCIGVGILLSNQSNIHPTNYLSTLPNNLTTNDLLNLEVFKYSTYFFIDIFLTIYLFMYCFFVCRLIGLLDSIIYLSNYLLIYLQDYIFNYVIELVDKKLIGLENVFIGLSFLQQWDDLIITQRRYLFLVYPEVKPSNLISLYDKIVIIQIASLLNLTIDRLSSSLGLTLLHVTMCSGHTEISKWLIHNYPQLLTYKDLQHDTPIMIALKECAHFLILFGQQKDNLDDGTSFSDASYSTYYPEIEDYRNDTDTNGEFIVADMLAYSLTASEVKYISVHGHFPAVGSADNQVDSATNTFTSTINIITKIVHDKKYIDTQLNQTSKLNKEKSDLKNDKNELKKRRIQQMKANELKKLEIESLYQKRFIEDSIVDDLESGQMTAWKILGLNIPEFNLYINQELQDYEKQHDNDSPRDNENLNISNDNDSLDQRNIEMQRILLPNNRLSSPKVLSFTGGSFFGRKSKIDKSDNLIDRQVVSQRNTQTSIDRSQMGSQIDSQLDSQIESSLESLIDNKIDFTKLIDNTTNVIPTNIPKDLIYVIPTNRRVIDINKNTVPNEILDLNDWHIVNKKYKKLSLLQRITNRKFFSSHLNKRVDNSAYSENSSVFSNDYAGVNEAVSKSDREIAYQLCKFAEIFMSKEMTQNNSYIRWDMKEYKEMGSVASQEQVKLAHHLAMVLHLNPPSGFARISDWLLGDQLSIYDDLEETNVSLITKTAVNIVSTVANIYNAITDINNNPIKSLIKPETQTAKSGRRKKRDLPTSISIDRLTDAENPIILPSQAFNDRIIHYLTELLISSRSTINLSDNELSVYGRLGFRSIARALRRRNSSYVIPSVFIGSQTISLLQLDLSRNELDDGDSILLADIALYQTNLEYLNISHNRIGSRGIGRLFRILKSHDSIITIDCSHNRIGPGCAKDLGLFLRHTKTLKCLNFSYNQLGELIRYPTFTKQEKMESAAKDLCYGLRLNTSLQSLDISYNNFGVSIAKYLHLGISRHPNLLFLNIAGNNLGPVVGPVLIYALSGEPRGERILRVRKKIYDSMRGEETSTNEFDIDSNTKNDIMISDELVYEQMQHIKSPKKKKVEQLDYSVYKPVYLVELDISNNQIGPMAGYAVSALLRRNPSLTSLNISDNYLGHTGGEAITDAIERLFFISSKDFIKQELEKIEESNYLLRANSPSQSPNSSILRNFEKSKKAAVKYSTNLMSLNLSSNNLGPRCFDSLINCLSNQNCTLTDLDLSFNPLGITSNKAGDAALTKYMLLSSSRTLTRLNLDQAYFFNIELISLFAGFINHHAIQSLILTNNNFDEPTCLQLSYVLNSLTVNNTNYLSTLDISNCSIGPKGGALIFNNYEYFCHKIKYLNLNNNYLGSLIGTYIGKGLASKQCILEVLYLKSNDLLNEGCEYVVRGLIQNTSLLDLDISDNLLTEDIAESLSLVPRGLYIKGKKYSSSNLKILKINDNPSIGPLGSVTLLNGLLTGFFTHIEIENIGASIEAARLIAQSLRDVSIRWYILKLSNNNFTKDGCNMITWALRNNKHVRSIHLSNFGCTSLFGTDEDGLLRHGVSINKAIKINLTIRELTLDYNLLTTNACNNIFEGLIDNYTMKKLTLRGNFIGDDISDKLSEMLRFNDVLEYLDLGYNNLGPQCLLAVAEGLEINRSLKYLYLDKNKLGTGELHTIDPLVRSLCVNHSLLVLSLDSNKLAHDKVNKLVEAIARNNTLQQLSLCDNRLDRNCGLLLLSAYRFSPQLLELGLSKDDVGIEVWEKYLEIYSLKNDLMKSYKRISSLHKTKDRIQLDEHKQRRDIYNKQGKLADNNILSHIVDTPISGPSDCRDFSKHYYTISKSYY